MSEITSLWWTDERVNATISRNYVLEHLDPEFHPQLDISLSFGDGLTDDSYLDWILEKGSKLFLILCDIGIQERIFALADEAYDDDDLPIASHDVSLLRLASGDSQDTSLNEKFFNAQWRFLVKDIKEGAHVEYGKNEGLPVELISQQISMPLSSKDGFDKVIVAGAVCQHRLRVRLDTQREPHFLDKEEILREIGFLRRLSHEHLTSAYASYFVDDNINLLISGTPEYSLKSFLADKPQQFKRLFKAQQRYLMLTWPHCLAEGLAWLHAHGEAHGAIRPSNILIDANNRIFLGLYEAFDTLIPMERHNDIEIYHYAAPEGWVRTTSVQNRAVSRTALPSGGRTARKYSSSRPITPTTNSKSPTGMGFNLHSIPYHSTTTEPHKIPESPSRMSYTSSSSGSSTIVPPSRKHILDLRGPRIMSNATAPSSSSGGTSRPVTIYSSTAVGSNAAPNNVIVQTWQSRQSSALPADIFALAAITLDIYTVLCKHRHSAFVAHRGAKNRHAGRGGGVADVSFHLDRNEGQVLSWITKLERDALRRSDVVYRGVRSMLAVVRRMLSRDPESRPLASAVAKEFANAIEGSGLRTHCRTKEKEAGLDVQAFEAIDIPAPDDTPQRAPSPLEQNNHSSPERHFDFKFESEQFEGDDDDDSTILEEHHEPGVLVFDSDDDGRWRDSSLLPMATFPPDTLSSNSLEHYANAGEDINGIYLKPSKQKMQKSNFSRPWGGGQSWYQQ
ncbi:serine/threonine protein kinase [Helicocarpus griseus UAMH5409]|uniref:Serine/threonine protein kinase n=1 Tax=Helicocarpus griseus UAMH5409 TaxID=1447875 RepID=A0A2B7XTS4_9EURO|nr:serine/threonine protein kinase [Helicocarpus griseus UAMH5409]